MWKSNTYVRNSTDLPTQYWNSVVDANFSHYPSSQIKSIEVREVPIYSMTRITARNNRFSKYQFDDLFNIMLVGLNANVKCVFNVIIGRSISISITVICTDIL